MEVQNLIQDLLHVFQAEEGDAGFPVNGVEFRSMPTLEAVPHNSGVQGLRQLQGLGAIHHDNASEQHPADLFTQGFDF